MHAPDFKPVSHLDYSTVKNDLYKASSRLEGKDSVDGRVIFSVAARTTPPGLLSRFKWVKVDVNQGDPIYINISSAVKHLKLSRKEVKMFKKDIREHLEKTHEVKRRLETIPENSKFALGDLNLTKDQKNLLSAYLETHQKALDARSKKEKQAIEINLKDVIGADKKILYINQLAIKDYGVSDKALDKALEEISFNPPKKSRFKPDIITRDDYKKLAWAIEHLRPKAEANLKANPFYRVKRSEVKKLVGVSRTLIFYPNGDVLVQSNKNHVIGKGSWKKVKISLNYRDSSLRAEANIHTSDDNFYLATSEDIEEEIKALEKLKDSPDAVQYHAHTKRRMTFTRNIKYKLVLDLYEGDFTGVITHNKNMSPQDKKRYALQMANAVGNAHKLGLVVRDVKEDNFLVDKNGDLILADLGMANAQNYLRGGSPTYVAPETYSDNQNINDFEFQAKRDVFSLGVVLYHLHQLKPDQRARFIRPCPHVEVNPPSFEPSPDLKALMKSQDPMAQLIVSMLEPDPIKRPSMLDVFQRLNDDSVIFPILA